ncbi:MAG: methyltransferase [Jannaschia sp.]
MNSRLSLALAAGAVILPAAGRIGLLRPPADLDLDGLPADRLVVQHGFRPDAAAFEARGVPVSTGFDGPIACAIVFAARAKALTLALLAQAFTAVGPGGLVILDGAKGDGVDSVIKLLRGVTTLGEVHAKAHGKCVGFPAPDIVPAGWSALPGRVDGFETVAGVFSADGVDPGSALLAEYLGGLSGKVCDLGAGWGYLAHRVLQSDKVTGVALVEAEQDALDCARRNVTDPRASFHWADATIWTGGPFDVVVSNPPFHASRKADAGLGQAFIAAAARLSTPRGRLLMVANRHLPYEATVREMFADLSVLTDRDGYKVIEATRPKRRKT